MESSYSPLRNFSFTDHTKFSEESANGNDVEKLNKTSLDSLVETFICNSVKF